jgi:hypothetical protein
LLNALGKLLHVRRLRGSQREVQASACAPDPEDNSRTIVVATLPCDDSDRCAGDAVVIVALLEGRPFRVVASYQGRIRAMELEDSDLRIQPTGYHLAQGASAFVIDAITQVALSAPSEGWSAARTLYVREANRLRPVLRGLSPFYWRLLPRQGHPVEASAIEKVELRLVVQDTSSAGYRDLLLLGTATRDDGQPSERTPFRLMLRYDGRRYPSGSLLGSFERWLGR